MIEGNRLAEQERLIMEVTEAIAALLQEQGMSRTELARRIGKSPAFITKLMRGEKDITLRTLSDVLFALGKSAHLSFKDIGDTNNMTKTIEAERDPDSTDSGTYRISYKVNEGPETYWVDLFIMPRDDTLLYMLKEDGQLVYPDVAYVVLCRAWYDGAIQGDARELPYSKALGLYASIYRAQEDRDRYLHGETADEKEINE